MMVMLMVRRGADEEDEVMLSIKLKRRDEDGKGEDRPGEGEKNTVKGNEKKMGTIDLDPS